MKATERELRAFHDEELRALGERIYGAPEWGAWPAGAMAELEKDFPYPWPLKPEVEAEKETERC